MVNGYNKLVAGGGEIGDPYTEIEPLISKEAIWDLIKKCRAKVEEAKSFKPKGGQRRLN
ncbi:hypothetical protein [Synechococcus sp. MIT S1220]|uniref:hypothetical protein n=1 Tax=Synechococcus sp. MIT S1220 TaxID=3082549 RepID=UPI0039AFFD4C